MANQTPPPNEGQNQTPPPNEGDGGKTKKITVSQESREMPSDFVKVVIEAEGKRYTQWVSPAIASVYKEKMKKPSPFKNAQKIISVG